MLKIDVHDSKTRSHLKENISCNTDEIQTLPFQIEDGVFLSPSKVRGSKSASLNVSLKLSICFANLEKSRVDSGSIDRAGQTKLA